VKAEAEMIWGDEIKTGPRSVVCDHCFRDMMAAMGRPYGHA
jgi:hypothetical protein